MKMKLIRKLKKILLIFSVFLCGYVQLIMVDRLLNGELPKHHLLIMAVVFAWLSLLYYANFVDR